MITVTYLSRNRPSHLERSLTSLLLQTIQPEHIVITDCSDNRGEIEDVIEMKKSSFNGKITFIYDKRLTRSMGRRLGRENADTPLVASTECDIFFPNNLIESALNAFGNPPSKCYAQPWFASQNKEGIIPEKPFHYKGGFFQVYRVEDYDAIGGYNPLLTEWGWEDNDFDERILLHGCKHVILPVMVHHMWHPPTANPVTNLKNQEIAKRSKWNVIEKKWELNDII